MLDSLPMAVSPSTRRNTLFPLCGRDSLASRGGVPDLRKAFSLIELLVVIAIMGILFALTGPVIGALKGSGDLGKAAGDIQGILEQARAYAVANNTYVYAGIQEVDALEAQADAAKLVSGIGRVAIALVASTTGLRPYTNTPAPLVPSSVTPLGKVWYFDNLHITNSASLSTSGNMNRPVAATHEVSDLSTNKAVTTFQWPLTGTPKYSFTDMVVEFSPQGTATVQNNRSSVASLVQYLELALLPARGNVATTNANQAAVQINGVTGSVTLYRP